MNMRSKFIAITGSALILASSITMGSAQNSDEGQAKVSVDPLDNNVITVSISETTDFGSVSYALDDQVLDQEMTVSVDDMRGTAEGWSVTLNATNFIPSDTSSRNANPIDIGELTLTPRTDYPVVQDQVSQPDANTDGQDAYTLDPVSITDQTLWTAADEHGAGTFDLLLDGDLNVPGGTLVGDYTSKVTVTLGSAPVVESVP